MSNNTQCVNPPASGASGSCMTRTNDLAPAGASFQARAGDGLGWPASHGNLGGVLAPSEKAALVRLDAAAGRNGPITDPPNLLSLSVFAAGTPRQGGPAGPNETGILAPTRRARMEVDRRAFLATLGSAAAISAMPDEAKAEALEHYMTEKLDEQAI